MFSSHALHKNIGLFTPHGESIGIKDPYEKPRKNNSKLKGTQFQVGKAAKDYFSPLQPLTIVPTASGYKSDPYTKERHKPDQKQLSSDAGFGSKDGRGIQNSVRASRMYAEKLKMETKALRKDNTFKNAGSQVLDTSAAAAAAAPSITLFDRCHAGEQDDSLRLKPGKGASKRIGSMTTTANVYGANVNDSPPVSGQFSRVAVTKSFYNDRSLELSGNNQFLNM